MIMMVIIIIVPPTELRDTVKIADHCCLGAPCLWYCTIEWGNMFPTAR